MASTLKLILSIVLLLASQGGCTPAIQLEGNGPMLTNLRMLQSLASRIGEQAAQAVPMTGRGLAVTITPLESAWAIEQELVGALRQRGFVVLGSPRDSAFVAEFGIADAHVTYMNVRREGFLGQRIVDRDVKLAIRAKVTDRLTGTIVLMKEWGEQRDDIVGLSQIESLETPGLQMTKGAYPPEAFFSGVLEPLVLLGAIAVAVVLLFSIRS